MPIHVKGNLYQELPMGNGAYKVVNNNKNYEYVVHPSVCVAGIPPGTYYTEAEFEAAKHASVDTADLLKLFDYLKNGTGWQQELYNRREKELIRLRREVLEIPALKARLRIKCYDFTRLGTLLGKARERNKKYHRLVKDLKTQLTYELAENMRGKKDLF